MQTLIWLGSGAAVGLALLLLGLGTAALLHRPSHSPAEDLLIALGAAVTIPALIILALLPVPVPFVAVCPFVAAGLLIASIGVLWHRRSWLLELQADSTVRLIAAGVLLAAVMALLIAP